MKSDGLEVYVNASEYPEAPVALIEDAVRHTLRSEGRAVGEISVTLLADPDIQELNRRYLSTSRPTDVIAFALGENPDTLADVYLGFDQAMRQASELGVPLEEELVRLAIHGTLHALGHDHPADSERFESPMFELQERLVRQVMDAHGGC